MEGVLTFIIDYTRQIMYIIYSIQYITECIQFQMSSTVCSKFFYSLVNPTVLSLSEERLSRNISTAIFQSLQHELPMISEEKLLCRDHFKRFSG